MGGSLVIGFVACNLLPVYLSKFVIRAGYNSFDIEARILFNIPLSQKIKER